LGGRATRLDQAHRSGLRSGGAGRRSDGRRDGARGCHPARVCPGGEMPLGGILGILCAAGLLPAGFGLHRASLSPAGRTGHGGATGECPDRHCPRHRPALPVVGRRAGIRHHQLRHAHRHHHRRGTGAARQGQEQAERSARRRTGGAGQRDRACAAAAPRLSGQRVGPGGAGGLLAGAGPVARGAGRRTAGRPPSRPHAGARRRLLERAIGTRSECGRLWHADLAAAEPQRRPVGAGTGGAAR